MKWLVWQAAGWLGWFFIELADKGDCWGPFEYAYRLGNWFYGQELWRGLEWGFIVENPDYNEFDWDSPRYVTKRA